jgi:hypothetical protein
MPMVVVLPFALTMNLGPQIVTTIVLVTGKDPIKKSLINLAGILVTAGTITFLAFIVFKYANAGSSTGERTQTTQILNYIFIALLVFLGLKNFIKRREVTKKPKWMSTLQEADGKTVFRIVLMLYSFMPTDLIAMLTVAHYLAAHQMRFYACLPFILVTLLIAASPLLFYILFMKRAERAMPALSSWMDTHAWLVNEIVIIFFICMILFT